MPDDGRATRARTTPLGGHPRRVQGRFRPRRRTESHSLTITTELHEPDRHLRHLRRRLRRLERPRLQRGRGRLGPTRGPDRGVEERIVVNMGPQHPSTRGVLRLILELDGETVTETRAGIGYLHTGIEEEHWSSAAHGRRAPRSAPGWTTRRSSTRPSSASAWSGCSASPTTSPSAPAPSGSCSWAQPDLLAPRGPATGGMEMGATTVMTVGFREREHPVHPRDGHRAADEPRHVRPGSVCRTSPGAVSRCATRFRWCAGPGGNRAAAQREPHPQGLPPSSVGYLDLTGCMALGIAGPGAALDGPARPAQAHPLLRLRDLRLRGHHPHRGRRLRPPADPHRRDVRVAEDRGAVHQPAAGKPGPVAQSRTRRSPGRPSSPSAATAWAAARPHREIMGCSWSP